MRKLSILWILIVALLLLAAPPLLANQEHKLRHRQGEIWVSCDPSMPVMDVGRAFVNAAVWQYHTGRPCFIKQQKGLWVFRHATKLEDKNPKR